MQIADSDSIKKEHSKREQIRENLSREQKALEEMVLKIIEKGDCNLGENASILKQSGKLDKLIVDEMMLREEEAEP